MGDAKPETAGSTLGPSRNDPRGEMKAALSRNPHLGGKVPEGSPDPHEREGRSKRGRKKKEGGKKGIAGCPRETDALLGVGIRERNGSRWSDETEEEE